MTRIIGILTGGGDVPGLNPAMKAMVTIALDNGIKVYGIRRGWAGLLEYDLNNPESQKNIYLHTSRTNPQRVKMNAVPEFLKDSPLGVKVDEDTMDYTAHVLKVLDHFGIQTLITIGGDDTLSFSVRLHKEGFPVIAIPKTMDNDVFGTDYCIGFSTAITRSVEVITNMRTSLGSHERIGVIELFGRNWGETSLLAAYLSGVPTGRIYDAFRRTGFVGSDGRNQLREPCRAIVDPK